MRTVADQFAEILAAAGVKRIYGIVGDSLNGITDSIRRQGKIEWLHVRHEEVAAFAAGAGATSPAKLRSVRAAAAPATFTSSTDYSIATAHACRCLRLQRIFRRPKSEPDTSRKSSSPPHL